MADWPSSLPAPSYGSGGESYKPQVRTPFEGPYVQSRPKVTLKKKRWPNLYWDDMSESDFAVLDAFFDSEQGNVFTNFPEPGTGTLYSARFSMDSIPWVWDNYGTRKVGPIGVEEI
jgi:hypothetical protein